MTVDVHESAGNIDTPAAIAAESLMNSRRESLDLLLVDVIEV
jgi:hypothetical protein